MPASWKRSQSEGNTKKKKEKQSNSLFLDSMDSHSLTGGGVAVHNGEGLSNHMHTTK